MPGAKKIIDVAHPGTTAATPTAKPVLVSNRPIMRDPMVATDEQATSAEESPAPLATPSASRLKIEPLSSPEKPESEHPETPTPTPKDAEEPKEKEKTEKAEPPATKPALANSEPVKRPDDAIKDGDAEAKAAEEAAAKEAALQKLIESKRYFLPIETLEKRRSKQTVIIGILVSVLLIAAWLDIALDAGLVHIPGLKALTHFFS